MGRQMDLSTRPSYRFGPFRLDGGERLLYQGGQPVPLTPRAIDTLLALVERHGRLVPKEELLREVWHDAFVEENNLAQHISMLRRVLARGGEGPFIETVPKRGYRFVAPVTEAREEPRAASPPAEVPAAPVATANTDFHPGGRSWGWALAAVPIVVVAWLAWVMAGGPADPATASGAEAHGTPRDPGLTRIAVLPFVNLGPAAEEYFASGITEEITSRLASVRVLGVVSSTSVREYDRRGKTIRQIAADLGVAYVVEGSVQSGADDGGGRLRVIPKLIRTADDTTIWTHQYDVARDALFSVQTDIAQQITGALHTVVSGNAEDPGTAAGWATSDPDAYLAYLRGMTAYQQSASDTSLMALGRRELEEAVRLDPAFAPAWSWLAQVYARQYNVNADRSPATRAAAFDAARRAIALAPDLPDAHLAYARALLTIDRDYDAALRELEIARTAAPNAPEVLRTGVFIQQRRGQWTAALALLRRAFDVDPAGTSDHLAVHYLLLRQYDQSRRFIALANSANRVAASVPEAWGLFSESGEVAGARAVLDRALSRSSDADARVRGLLSRLEWFDGRYARALEIIRQMDPAGAWLPANFRFPAAIAAGQVYESMGESELAVEQYSTALAALERRAREDPDDYQVEAAMGLALAGLGRGDDAVQHASRAVALLPVSKDALEGPLYLYMLATVQARVGRLTEAFATLDRLFAVPGFYNESWIRRDPWFASLRDHPDCAGRIRRWAIQKGEVLGADFKP